VRDTIDTLVTTHRIGSFLACLLVVGLAAGPVAHADKEKSLTFYRLGKKHYKAAEFQKALSNFLAAYNEHNAPAYLFNIAQAFRQLGNCPEALAHYKQFLAEDPETKVAKVVNKHIDALDKECGRDEPPAKPADPVDPPPDHVTAPPAPQPATVAKQTTTRGKSAHGLTTLAEAGAAIFDIGEVDVPLVAAVRVGAGYRWTFGKLEIDGGLSVELSTMKYEDIASGTAALVTVAADFGVAYRVASTIRVRGEVGLGDMMFSGLDDGNPFTMDGQAQSAIHMFTTRVGIGLDYLVTPQLGLHLSPLVFATSANNKKLASDIDSITRFAFLAGVVYAL
jgi:hypothetical protein